MNKTAGTDAARRDDLAAKPVVSRRDVILEVATRLFYEQGVANVGMRAIAEEVGIRPASLYHHFRSKEEILYALGIRVAEQWSDEARDLLHADSDPRAAIKTLMYRAIVFNWQHHAAFEVAYRELREMTAEHAAELRFHRSSYRKMIRRYIERGVESGNFRVVSPTIATLAIIQMQSGVAEWFKEPGTSGPSARLQSIEQVASTYADLVADHLLV
jgi:AcrR family transcriptional regulator